MLIDRRTDIDATSEQVWALVKSLDLYPEWHPGATSATVTKTVNDLFGEGSEFTVEHRGGSRSTYAMTHYSSNTFFGYAGTHRGTAVERLLTLHRREGGSWVRYEMLSQSFLMGILPWLYKGRLQREAQGVLDALKRRVETDPPPVEPAPPPRVVVGQMQMPADPDA